MAKLLLLICLLLLARTLEEVLQIKELEGVVKLIIVFIICL